MAIQKQLSCCRRSTADGREQLIVETSAGQRITLQDGPPSILIEDSGGNSIRLENGRLTLSTPGNLVIQAAAIEINAELMVNAVTTRFSGTVQADTVIANNVVASSYTPGAGNVW